MTTFQAELKLDGKSATGIEVPQEIIDGFNAGKKIAVTVEINGYSYRSSVGPYQGVNKLPVSAENRSGAGISAGDVVDVTLELDTAPRVVEVPDDLAAALATDAAAQAAFAALSFSAQKAHVASVTSAKTEATRERRIQKVLTDLS